MTAAGVELQASQVAGSVELILTGVLVVEEEDLSVLVAGSGVVLLELALGEELEDQLFQSPSRL